MIKFSDIEKERIFQERTRLFFPQVWENYQDLVAHEKMSRDELYAYGWGKRIEILTWAYNNSPFYRNLYDKLDISPFDVKEERDWDSLPIISKQDVRENCQAFIVGSKQDFETEMTTTSGTSGMPLTVYFERVNRLPGKEWRFLGWWLGREKGSLACKSPILGVNEAWVRRMSGYGALTSEMMKKNASKVFPKRYLGLDSHTLTQEAILRFNEDAESDDVYFLYGYADAVAELARQYSAGLPRGNYHPKLVYTGGGVLTKTDRELIRSVFGCPVFDIYGCNELGRLAAECPCNDTTLHVFSDILHLDLVDDAGCAIHDEREGKTVFTSLVEHYMPLIRYEIGDRTHFINEKCSCGLPFPRIAQVKGRQGAFLYDKNHGKISAIGLTATFDDMPEIVRKFRYVQKIDGEVDLEVVPRDRHEKTLHSIKSCVDSFSADMRSRIAVQLRILDTLPYDGGKFDLVVHKQ